MRNISFSPYGAWLVHYQDDTVQLSQQGQYSQKFHTLTSAYLNPCGATPYSRHPSMVKAVFGAEDNILVQTTSGVFFDGICNGLTMVLNGISSTDHLGPNTVLCRWNKNYFFVEITSSSGQRIYRYSLPPHPILTLPFVEAVVAGNIPSQAPTLHSQPMTFPPGQASPQPSVSQPISTPQPLGYHSPATLGATPIHGSISPPPSGKPPPTSSQIPDAYRRQYEQQFHAHSGGKPYLTGLEASEIFLSTGLRRLDLTRIWELTDADQNGEFDRQEFVRAMWLIHLQCSGQTSSPVSATAPTHPAPFPMSNSPSAGHPPPTSGSVEKPILWVDSDCCCEGCCMVIPEGNAVFHCTICAGGDYDLCQRCVNAGRTCGHHLTPKTVRIKRRSAVQTRTAWSIWKRVRDGAPGTLTATNAPRRFPRAASVTTVPGASTGILICARGALRNRGRGASIRCSDCVRRPQASGRRWGISPARRALRELRLASAATTAIFVREVISTCASIAM